MSKRTHVPFSGMPSPIRIVLICLGVAAVLCASYAIALESARVPGLDFKVYRAGGAELLNNPSGLYAPILGPVHDPGLPFTYPPFAAVLFSVFALMPFEVGYLLLNAVSLVIGLLVVRDLTTRAHALFPRAARWMPLWLTATVFVASGPFRDTILLGQVNIILMGAAYLTAVRFKSLLPFAVAIGLCAGVKLTPLALMLVPLALGRILPILVAAGTFLATQLATLLVMPDLTVEFWTKAVVDPSRVGGLEYIDNLSLRGVLERVGAPQALWLVLAVLTVGVFYVAMRTLRTRLSIASQLGLGGACAALISPVTWSHHWVWFPLFAFALAEASTLVTLPWRRVFWAACGFAGAVLFLTPKLIVRCFGMHPDDTLPWWVYVLHALFVIAVLGCSTAVAASAFKDRRRLTAAAA
ncbi:glycosyltransferase 87 family protein [Galactobacter caseinivorans]|nr:glycosyltransferase 87 family protein [Galactobacter caseinivorans]